MEPSRFLEIGRIINTHGVKGEMKVEPWADGPEQLQSLKAVHLDGREMAVRRWRTQGRFMILSLDGIDTPEAAMALKGKVLTADREALPLPEGRYYIWDMIGLPVLDRNGTPYRGFLEGRVDGDKYLLLLHLTNLELKELPNG